MPKSVSNYTSKKIKNFITKLKDKDDDLEKELTDIDEDEYLIDDYYEIDNKSDNKNKKITIKNNVNSLNVNNSDNNNDKSNDSDDSNDSDASNDSIGTILTETDDEIHEEYLLKIMAIKEGNIRENLEKDREHIFIKIVPKEERITTDVISRYEYTEVISIRAKHIENGGMIYTDIKNETNPIKMAEMEIHDRKCPLTIIRYINYKTIELWEVNELIIPLL